VQASRRVPDGWLLEATGDPFAREAARGAIERAAMGALLLAARANWALVAPLLRLGRRPAAHVEPPPC
jgi:hypothetical protein